MMKIYKITLVFLLLLIPLLSMAQVSNNTDNYGLASDVIKANIEQGIIIKDGSFIIRNMDIISPYIPIDEPIYDLGSNIPTDASRVRNQVIKFGIEDEDDDDRGIVKYFNLRVAAP